MQILMIACSKKGYELMCRIRKQWEKVHEQDEIISKVKSSELVSLWEEQKELTTARKQEIINSSIKDLVGEYFQTADAILFISATGIAVRCIAPYLVHKSTDPAVVTIDESGKYCISLLSGHMGGANELTRDLAEMSGSEAVITTATDCEGKFAVDDFARQNQFVLDNWKKAKNISVSVLKGDRLHIYLPEMETSSCKVFGKVPEEVSICFEKNEAEVVVSPFKVINEGKEDALHLIPKWITAGIGCKKNIASELVEEALQKACEEANVDIRSIKQMASIDLKKEEAGLLRIGEKYQLPFRFFSAEELKAAEGTFEESSFVESITGVGNVCERSAVLASGGQIIFGKHAYNGVTVAFAIKTEAIRFE